MTSPLPLGQQILLLVLAPPIVALLVAIMNRGWATAVFGVLGRKVSDTTRNEQVWEFWLVLWGGYAMGIGMFIYAHVWR